MTIMALIPCLLLSYSQAIYFRKYTTQSDVWSFGAVLYEIWSVGYKPFEQYTNQEVLLYSYKSYLAVMIVIVMHVLLIVQYIKLVDSGYRLPSPPGCPRSVYEIMINCWYARLIDKFGYNINIAILL